MGTDSGSGNQDLSIVGSVTTESGVTSCGCSDVTARGEGCNQPSRGSGCGCGCAIVTGMGSGDATYSHASGYRGILVSTSSGSNFYTYGDLTSLYNHLSGIATGTTVAIATNDEPFSYWYGNSGNIGTNLNNLLVSMGMPAPNGGTLSSDMYRASYAGVGQVGCGSSCPAWTGSTYTGRYADVAIFSTSVCASTPSPTPYPTPYPTPSPTPFPTPYPTPYPTPSPTPSFGYYISTNGKSVACINPITTSAECQQAATALGRSWDGDRSWSDRLGGCLHTVGEADVNFNSNFGGVGNNNDQVPICAYHDSTPNPTPYPTPYPTPSPTPSPTPYPTPYPTPSPTP